MDARKLTNARHQADKERKESLQKEVDRLQDATLRIFGYPVALSGSALVSNLADRGFI